MFLRDIVGHSTQAADTGKVRSSDLVATLSITPPGHTVAETVVAESVVAFGEDGDAFTLHIVPARQGNHQLQVSVLNNLIAVRFCAGVRPSRPSVTDTVFNRVGRSLYRLVRAFARARGASKPAAALRAPAPRATTPWTPLRTQSLRRVQRVLRDRCVVSAPIACAHAARSL